MIAILGHDNNYQNHGVKRDILPRAVVDVLQVYIFFPLNKHKNVGIYRWNEIEIN